MKHNNQQVFLYTNVLGSFIVDDSLKLLEEGEEKLLIKKFPGTKALPDEKKHQVLALFKDRKYFQKFYIENLNLTKESLRHSVSEDQMIIQAIANINELDKTTNMLAKRLREWYSWYYPELSEKITDHAIFAELILTEKKNKESMGAELQRVHLEEMFLLAEEISRMYVLRKKHEDYLERTMREYCPNILELAGVTIGAKLIELGRGVKHLALLPASTIQLLGAEKALFRHIKTGAKSPKYGVIINHPIITKARRDDKGKAARMLADKLSLCARLDYFKGEFKAKQYRAELDQKLNQPTSQNRLPKMKQNK